MNALCIGASYKAVNGSKHKDDDCGNRAAGYAALHPVLPR
jgi:hypothetical protein